MEKKKRKKARTSGVKTHALSSRRRLSCKGLDPDKAYRHVKKDDNGVGFREQDGWVVCKDDKVKGAKETHDLILMETSKENHDILKKIPGAISKRRVTGIGGTGADGIEEFEKTTTIRDKPQKDLQNAPEEDIFE